MVSNLLSDPATSMPLISAAAGVAAVSICTIISALISALSAKNIKKSEQLFREMVAAYYDFLRICEELSDLHNLDQLRRYGNASTRALLFASRRTRNLIREYGQSVSAVLRATELNSPEVFKIAQSSSELREKLVQAMKRDLKK